MYSVDCSSWHCICSRGRRNIAYSLLFVASTALVAIVELNVEAKELPLSPINLTIEEIFSTAAVLKWTVVSFDIEEESSSSGYFQLIVQRMGHPAEANSAGGDQQLTGHSSRIIDVPGIARSFLIQFLIPDTGYRVYAATINDHGRSNVSDPVDFQTLLDGTVNLQHYQMHSAEVAIIVFILSAWLCTVGLFLHKWRRIRILPPREPRFKHHPKNLDTIKVVKRPTDSVIYKSYTKQISTTMQARQKKLERMSTMPNIKVTVEASTSPDGNRKTGRSALTTLAENRVGIRPSASGPAAFEVFEQLLAAPPSAHLIQTESPDDVARTGLAEGDGVGGRKRISSDSEVIRMAREFPEVGRRWAKDIAGNAARVVQIRTNWDRDRSAKADVSKNASDGSPGIETELSLNSNQEKSPCNASKITLVLTKFEEDIAEDETEFISFCRPSESEQHAMEEGFEKASIQLTNWDKDFKEIIYNDAAQVCRHSLEDNSSKEIKVTQLSGIWGTNEVNENSHLLKNCVDDTTAKSSRRARDCGSTSQDKDAKDFPIAEHFGRSSTNSSGADIPSVSVNGGSSVNSF